jgi:hypothetical protein
LNTIFEVLSQPRRRYVLYCLHREETMTSDFETLVNRVAELESRTVPTDVATAETVIAEIAASLHHQHLPKLADSGLVDYDPRSKSVRYWPHPRMTHWIAQAASDEEL